MSLLSTEGYKPNAREIAARKQGLDKNARDAKTVLGNRNASVFNSMDVFPGLSIDELHTLGHRILSQENVFEGYNLMATTPLDGRGNYYDRIIGPQHYRGYDVLKLVLSRFEPTRVSNALDIAAGTGESTVCLASTAQSITGIDMQESLLKRADVKLKALLRGKQITSYQLQVMDATQLDFPDNHFDIVLEQALIAYLTPAELTDYRKGVLRILKPQGRYYTYLGENYESDIYETSPRAVLAGQVAGALFSFSKIQEHRTNPLSVDAQDFGFEGGYISITGRPYRELVLRWLKP